MMRIQKKPLQKEKTFSKTALFFSALMCVMISKKNEVNRLSHDSNCIFCKIVSGDIPSYKVYEDENVLAFLDISQVTKGHTLIIPKEHSKDIFELSEETAAKLFSTVPKIASSIKQTFKPIGLNLLNNNGEAAGQSVFHYHMHFIPRYGAGDGFGAVWKTQELPASEMAEIAQNIQENIRK
jgi:histidine triad (HIT) family protein